MIDTMYDLWMRRGANDVWRWQKAEGAVEILRDAADLQNREYRITERTVIPCRGWRAEDAERHAEKSPSSDRIVWEFLHDSAAGQVQCL